MKMIKIIQKVLYIIPGILLFIVFNKQIVSAMTEDQVLDYSKVKIVIEKDENGINQLKAMQDSKTLSITNHSFNHANPSLFGKLVVWMSQIDSHWQIFLKDIPSDKVVQLTFLGNNVNPQVNERYIAWERQVNGIWQIVVYNGYKMTQITNSSAPSQLIELENDFTLYQQKAENGEGWNLFLYDIVKSTTKNLSEGMLSGPANLDGDFVEWVATNLEGRIYKNTYSISSGTLSAEDITSVTPYSPKENHEPLIERAHEQRVVTFEEVEEEFIDEPAEIVEENIIEEELDEVTQENVENEDSNQQNKPTEIISSNVDESTPSQSTDDQTQ